MYTFLESKLLYLMVVYPFEGRWLTASDDTAAKELSLLHILFHNLNNSEFALGSSKK